ncbi:MAG: Rne/Rng family ribonuclease [Proteobacteria bacterium]|nr:Rne/Rng family ribonuclease [Pseudomonadota bacterium]
MTRKILINGRREEELRVAIVENQTLEDFEIETKRRGVIRNNIYRAVVTNIAPSLNAAFVDFGDARNGFLAFNDVVESVYSKPGRDSYRISDVLTVGQELIVQVIKDASALKGAQVTTNVSLAGRYLVLRPRDAKSGVSHKLDDDARADLTQKIRSLDLPDGYGCIVRTNAMDQSRAILLRDAKVLVQLWHKIEAEFARGKGPQLLYNDQDIVVQAMRDYFDSSINEVIIDDKCCYERARAYVRATIASSEDKLKYYDDKMPLFTRYGIERQIEQIYARTVRLPSGGFIVIDPTEALTAIDVNSAHSTKRESQDQTAYSTNLEAAVEIGRQLRMRDIGGLIVIDFIDMRQGKYQRDVERVMRNALSRDKARCKVERISANGLLEINRQRISQALSQRTHLECPTCGGRGFIPSADAIGMTLIREIDAHAVDGKLGGVIIKLHPDIAQQLQNERRREFAQLELDYGIRIEIVASRDVTRGAEEIEWLSKSQAEELHPERVCAPSQDAASIVDVAEAYQASETEEGGYRPNDFEEFSSDEARKKRAAKRAARREAEQKAQAEAGNSKAASAKQEPKAEAECAETPKNGKTEPAKNAKREQGEAKAEPSDMDARDGIGVSLLGIFVAEMKGRMEVSRPANAEKPGRHRPSFRARRKSGRGENLSLQSDMRLFVTDILRAVCVLACGCDRDVPRREMLQRMDEVSDWLMDAGQQDRAECHKRVIALRNQISSRHACARMNCLFDVHGHARPDELARLLLEACRAVGSYEVTDERIAALTGWFSDRCARIFGEKVDAEEVQVSVEDAASEESAAPVVEQASVPELDIDASLLEAVENMDMDALEAAFRSASADLPAEDGVVLTFDAPEIERENSRRPRSSRRHAIGEKLAQPLVEDGLVVTADVVIAPMVAAEREDKADADNEALGVAITQELPAVASRRARRSRRGQRGEISEQPEMTAAEPAVDRLECNAVSIEKTEEVPVKAEVAVEPVDVEPKADSALLSQIREGGQVSTRRVRHTRRMSADVVRQAYDVSPAENNVSEPVAAPVMPEPVAVKAEPVAVMDAVEPENIVAAVDASMHDVNAEHGSRSRRMRRTSRASIGGFADVSDPIVVPEIVDEVLEAVETPVAAANETPVVVETVEAEAVAASGDVVSDAAVSEVPKKSERRRNRRSADRAVERESKQAREPQAVESESKQARESQAVEREDKQPREPQAIEREDKQPRERRVRSTRAKRNRAEASVEAVAVPALSELAVIPEVVSQPSDVDISLMITGEMPVVAEEVRHSRRVRRTRSSEEVRTVSAPVEARPVVSEPAAEAHQAVSASVEAPKIQEDASKQPGSRAVRRTRRTRREDAEAVMEAAAAPSETQAFESVAEPQVVSEPQVADASADEVPVARNRARRTRRARPDAE